MKDSLPSFSTLAAGTRNFQHYPRASDCNCAGIHQDLDESTKSVQPEALLPGASASNRPYYETYNRTIRITWYVSTV